MSDPRGETERPEAEDRRVIDDLGRRQLRKMRANAGKAHWSTVSRAWLFTRLLEEVAELAGAIESGDQEEIADECADVANMAAMLADGRLSKKLPERE